MNSCTAIFHFLAMKSCDDGNAFYWLFVLSLPGELDGNIHHFFSSGRTGFCSNLVFILLHTHMVQSIVVGIFQLVFFFLFDKLNHVWCL